MRYITQEDEMDRTWYYLALAAAEALKSICSKSRRGAVIVDKDGKILGRGHNKVTILKLCQPCIREDIKDNTRVELCSAIHAEQLAVLDALRHHHSFQGARMYHIKIGENGKMRPSGKPSCTVCSRVIVEIGIEFVLWHSEGLTIYSSAELNELSFRSFVPE